MKKLQLFKYITGEIVKNQIILKGEKDNDNIFFTDGYVVWIVPKKDDIFKDTDKKTDLAYMFESKKIKNLKLIDAYIVLDNEEIKRGQKIAIGKVDGKEFYFNSSCLKYFDPVPMLYKYDSDPCSPIYVKNNDILEGVILPIRIVGDRKEKIKKSLSEQIKKAN